MALMSRFVRSAAAIAVLALMPMLSRAAEPIKFEQETLANGLRVIYAPLPMSPVVHVRVLYHVGSRDERADRQGFAHMFEHMMFRGSGHVAPEEHMKTIGMVGGYSNAFTSFDETVYVNTVPAPYLATALYLEADRMSSFKVSPTIFTTERKVVAQEWALRQNQPYGSVIEELLGRMFTKHPYHWTPIGNMDHLKAASAEELQAFFNKYYVPNNAVLVVAGKFDVPATKAMVKKYYGWIPGKALAVTITSGTLAVDAYSPTPVERSIAKEPEQKESRRAELKMNVPLARVMIAYPLPPISSDDLDALSVLGTIVGDGRSSRLSRLLVTSENPLCTSADAMEVPLEDGGAMGVNAMVLPGKSSEEVEKVILAAVAELKEKGVTAEELAKAKQQARLALASQRETAEHVASALGSEALMRNDPERVNTEEARLAKVTAEDVLAVARKYLRDERSTTLIITPDPTAGKGSASAPAAATNTSAPATSMPATAEVKFPPDYPAKAPLPTSAIKASFEKGVEKTINGVKVIVMPDRHIPLVNWNLTMRAGSDSVEKGKEGLGGLAASMVRRGPKGTTFNAFNEDLESRAVTLEVSDGADLTRVSGQCLTEQLPYAMDQMRKLLREPAFAAEEFARLKAQTLSGLRMSLNSPTAVAGIEISRLVFDDTPMGRSSTPASVAAITLDDVKAYYGRVFRATDAILIISGDVSVEDGQNLAEKLLDSWHGGELPKVSYELPQAAGERTILLVDRPESKQSNVRLGIRSYSIRSDEKFGGSLASQMLSAGIDSRLGRYVRAEKGLTYSVYGAFSPTRHAGSFMGSVDTRVETTSDAITAMFDVFEKMRRENVGEKELTEAKLRVAGSMVMQMQTMSQQAARRVEAILNGYPIDYYDTYAERIAKVTAEEIRGVMNKYVDDGKISIVVVAPAEGAKEQLEKLGKVEVLPMPLQRGKAATIAP